MKWQIISVGKPALPWAKMAVEDYAQRVQRIAQVDMVTLKQAAPAQLTAKALELTQGTWRVLLDERGRQMGSVDFARWIDKQEMQGRKAVSLFVGGADGHPDELRRAADETWSLSLMTLQHELALVVLLEQLYRAFSIQRGDPYHRP
jgi:23S rRNA (pseudouridine1915-N3)-methyltransferase